MMNDCIQDRVIGAACFFLDLDAADTERSRIGEQFLREFGDGDDVRSDGVGDVVGNPLVQDVGAACAHPPIRWPGRFGSCTSTGSRFGALLLSTSPLRGHGRER